MMRYLKKIKQDLDDIIFTEVFINESASTLFMKKLGGSII